MSQTVHQISQYTLNKKNMRVHNDLVITYIIIANEDGEYSRAFQ
jgi:hypothetical protein